MGLMGLMGLMGYGSHKSHKSDKPHKSNSWPPDCDSALRPFRLSGEFQFAARLVEINDHGLAVADLAFQDAAAKRRFDLALDRALQGARAVDRVITGAHQMRARRFGQFQVDVAFGQAAAQPVELYLH